MSESKIDPRPTQTPPQIESILKSVAHGEIKSSLVTPTMISLAQLSLAMKANERPHHSTGAIVESGAQFNCQVAQKLAHLRQTQPFDQAMRYLQEIAQTHQLYVALPQTFRHTPADHRDGFCQAWLRMKRGEANPIQSPKLIRPFSDFCQQIKQENDKCITGVVAEFVCFCLLDYAQTEPRHATPQQDIFDQTDFFTHIDSQNIAFQVKSHQGFQFPFFTVSPPTSDRKTYLIEIDTPRFLADNAKLLQQIYSPDTPPNDIGNIFTRQLKKIISYNSIPEPQLQPA